MRPSWMGHRRAEGHQAFCSPPTPSTTSQGGALVMTKAQQTYERIEQLMEAGTSRTDAFKQIAEEHGQPVASIRGAYYTGRKQAGEGGTTRTRKRETTAEDAVQAAIVTLRRSIEKIDAEIEVAANRALEAQAEHEAMRESADPRKKEIEQKIAALES